MKGDTGNDIFYVDSASDALTEVSGTDTVISTVAWTLAADFENLTLIGSSAVNGTGNTGDNILDGSQNSAVNTLTGGAGNDTYIIGASDVIVEAASSGTDMKYNAMLYMDMCTLF